MSLEVQQLLPALKEYVIEVQDWTESNNLVDLPPFKDLHDKDIWGECYRADQIYYETIADYKNKLYGVKGAALNLIAEKYSSVSQRSNKQITEKLVEQVENDISLLDNLLYKARARLKFYETVTYVVGNATYGGY